MIGMLQPVIMNCMKGDDEVHDSPDHAHPSVFMGVVMNTKCALDKKGDHAIHFVAAHARVLACLISILD